MERTSSLLQARARTCSDLPSALYDKNEQLTEIKAQKAKRRQSSHHGALGCASAVWEALLRVYNALRARSTPLFAVIASRPQGGEAIHPEVASASSKLRLISFKTSLRISAYTLDTKHVLMRNDGNDMKARNQQPQFKVQQLAGFYAYEAYMQPDDVVETGVHIPTSSLSTAYLKEQIELLAEYQFFSGNTARILSEKAMGLMTQLMSFAPHSFEIQKKLVQQREIAAQAYDVVVALPSAGKIFLAKKGTDIVNSKINEKNYNLFFDGVEDKINAHRVYVLSTEDPNTLGKNKPDSKKMLIFYSKKDLLEYMKHVHVKKNPEPLSVARSLNHKFNKLASEIKQYIRKDGEKDGEKKKNSHDNNMQKTTQLLEEIGALYNATNKQIADYKNWLKADARNYIYADDIENLRKTIQLIIEKISEARAVALKHYQNQAYLAQYAIYYEAAKKLFDETSELANVHHEEVKQCSEPSGSISVRPMIKYDEPINAETWENACAILNRLIHALNQFKDGFEKHKDKPHDVSEHFAFMNMIHTLESMIKQAEETVKNTKIMLQEDRVALHHLVNQNLYSLQENLKKHMYQYKLPASFAGLAQMQKKQCHNEFLDLYNIIEQALSAFEFLARMDELKRAFEMLEKQSKAIATIEIEHPGNTSIDDLKKLDNDLMALLDFIAKTKKDFPNSLAKLATYESHLSEHHRKMEELIDEKKYLLKNEELETKFNAINEIDWANASHPSLKSTQLSLKSLLEEINSLKGTYNRQPKPPLLKIEKEALNLTHAVSSQIEKSEKRLQKNKNPFEQLYDRFRAIRR